MIDIEEIKEKTETIERIVNESGTYGTRELTNKAEMDLYRTIGILEETCEITKEITRECKKIPWVTQMVWNMNTDDYSMGEALRSVFNSLLGSYENGMFNFMFTRMSLLVDWEYVVRELRGGKK